SYRKGVRNSGARNVNQEQENANRNFNNGGNFIRMPVRNVDKASTSKPASVQYVPVSNKSSKDPDEFENVSKKSKAKVSEARQSKKGIQEEIQTQNRFFALNEEVIDVAMGDGQNSGEISDIGYKGNSKSGTIKKKIQMLEREVGERSKNIDPTTNSNATILAKEKMKETGLSMNLTKPGLYDEMYRQEAAEIDDLRVKKQMLEVDLFMCLKAPLTEEVKDTWTDEMVEYYDYLVELRRGDEVNGHFGADDNDDMSDESVEVAEDLSAHASFMTQNAVSNIADADMAQMHNQDASSPYDVPIQVFEEEGISLIATYLGKPIMLDSYTSSMCKES
ncbi:hypothetical protein Tco_1136887, partial [Tanacetum coccineum]